MEACNDGVASCGVFCNGFQNWLDMIAAKAMSMGNSMYLISSVFGVFTEAGKERSLVELNEQLVASEVWEFVMRNSSYVSFNHA